MVQKKKTSKNWLSFCHRFWSYKTGWYCVKNLGVLYAMQCALVHVVLQRYTDFAVLTSQNWTLLKCYSLWMPAWTCRNKTQILVENHKTPSGEHTKKFFIDSNRTAHVPIHAVRNIATTNNNCLKSQPCSKYNLAWIWCSKFKVPYTAMNKWPTIKILIN